MSANIYISMYHRPIQYKDILMCVRACVYIYIYIDIVMYI